MGKGETVVPIENTTRAWYDHYNRKYGSDRNSMRHNPGVLLQKIATDISVFRAFGSVPHNPQAAQVLDVGSGMGSDIYHLLRMGYLPENITGIDILTENIEAAKHLYPHIRFIHGDARRVEYADDAFDLVFESTMFATLPDDNLSGKIAAEMVRVCKSGGYILLIDWRTPKPFDSNYKALTQRRLRAMFSVGTDTRLIQVFKGALVPPLGRFLSKWLPSAYFITAAMMPFLVGQVTYLLQKQSRPE
jgi:ubiquinone/menaquinone biosynthesis C-methylase UbiE